MARLSSTAATVESTPPLSPNTTLSPPTLARSSATVVSINDSGVHDWAQPQIPTTKFFRMVSPSTE